MRSVILSAAHQRLEERDTPEPFIEHPDQVRFRVHEVGVCGTDREIASFRWERLRPKRDLIIGHEALGQVIETGAAVEGIAPGDWVVPMIRRACVPACPSCKRGRTDLCLTYRYTERGIFAADGYFAEFAVDQARHLVRVPEKLLPNAILLEPLSVVEKAVERAIAVRQTDQNRALVLGLGPIGILSALVLQLRGYQVRVYSLEPADHPRARLLASQGIGYTTSLDGSAGLILEAAGSADLALAALRLLGSAGVFVTLGAQSAEGRFSFDNLVIGNQTIVGSVNANPASFQAALADLAAIPAPALNAMIRRFDFADYRRTIFEHPGPEPKYVHMVQS
jgi:threonine dehydrogenase-like Zn-dependent dehydrogenase